MFDNIKNKYVKAAIIVILSTIIFTVLTVAISPALRSTPIKIVIYAIAYFVISLGYQLANFRLDKMEEEKKKNIK
ncbi:MAG: hypothetical protein Q8936_02600 [Bacillota bacterium]|nr:hypothetical protein [Bacillota bacterium]